MYRIYGYAVLQFFKLCADLLLLLVCVSSLLAVARLLTAPLFVWQLLPFLLWRVVSFVRQVFRQPRMPRRQVCSQSRALIVSDVTDFLRFPASTCTRCGSPSWTCSRSPSSRSRRCAASGG